MNANPFDAIVFLIPGLASFWMLLRAILWLVLDISFALAVLADARELELRLQRRPFFVGGWIWALATLFGGVFVAAIYWVIHHSTLRPQPFAVESTENPTTLRPPQA